MIVLHSHSGVKKKMPLITRQASRRRASALFLSAFDCLCFLHSRFSIIGEIVLASLLLLSECNLVSAFETLLYACSIVGFD